MGCNLTKPLERELANEYKRLPLSGVEHLGPPLSTQALTSQVRLKGSVGDLEVIPRLALIPREDHLPMISSGTTLDQRKE